MTPIAAVIEQRPALLANKLIASSKVLTEPTNSLLIASSLACKDVDKFLGLYQDLVPPQWAARHAKFVYRFGYYHYEKNAAVARTKTNPQAYMARLITLNFEKHGLTAPGA